MLACGLKPVILTIAQRLPSSSILNSHRYV